MLIGDFARRAGLSAKALRRYDELGLLRPARTDATTGYRWYEADQIDRARLVAMLRRIDMPLAGIAGLLDLDPSAAADELRRYWTTVEESTTRRRTAVAHLCHLLEKGEIPMPIDRPVAVRTVPARTLLTSVQHVHESEAAERLGQALAGMRAAGPGLSGLDGCPFLVYHGEVSADGDGPVELSRPVAGAPAVPPAGSAVRHDPAHDEAYVVLTMAETRWPDDVQALEALKAHVVEFGRTPAGLPRQIMIADWRTAADDEPASLLAVPLAEMGT